MLNTVLTQTGEVKSRFVSGEKNYFTETVSPRVSSGAGNRKKVLLAKIILLLCILALIAARSFG